jgi:hypothetical protein
MLQRSKRLGVSGMRLPDGNPTGRRPDGPRRLRYRSVSRRCRTALEPGGVGQGLRPDKLQTLRPHRLKWEIPTLTGQNVCLIHASFSAHDN